jgi:hypothetical protein
MFDIVNPPQAQEELPPLLNPYALFGLDPDDKEDDEAKPRKFKSARRKADLLAHPDEKPGNNEAMINNLPNNLQTVLNLATDEIEQIFGPNSNWQNVKRKYGASSICYFWNPWAARNTNEVLLPLP